MNDEPGEVCPWIGFVRTSLSATVASPRSQRRWRATSTNCSKRTCVANNPGYGKIYVELIVPDGAVTRDFKLDIDPSTHLPRMQPKGSR